MEFWVVFYRSEFDHMFCLVAVLSLVLAKFMSTGNVG